MNGGAHRYDASAMPVVTFTDPQVATVGLTEAQAKERGIDVKTSLLPMEAVPRALAARDTRGVIKLVADRATDRLLGAHILAPEAGDSIQTAAIAIKAKMSAAELAATIFPYLTTVEGLKLAAQTFEKDVSKLSCCAGWGPAMAPESKNREKTGSFPLGWIAASFGLASAGPLI